MSRHGPDPERLAAAELVGTARRLAMEQGSIAEAVARLQTLGAGRNDLLTEGAGLGVGSWAVAPGMPADLLAAGLLASAVHRLDLDLLTSAITIGQQRTLSGYRYRA